MWVCVKLCVENAHNAMARVAILETVETEQSLRHLTLHYAATSAAPTALESGGQVWGEGEEGLTQGRPGSSGRFCAGLHPDVRQLDAEMRDGGGAQEGGGLFLVTMMGTCSARRTLCFRRWSASLAGSWPGVHCAYNGLRRRYFVGGICRQEPLQT